MLLIKLVEPIVNETIEQGCLTREKYLELIRKEFFLFSLINSNLDNENHKDQDDYDLNSSELFPIACPEEVFFFKKGFVEACLQDLSVLAKQILRSIEFFNFFKKSYINGDIPKDKIKKLNDLIKNKLEEEYPEENLQFLRIIFAEICDFHFCKLFHQDKDADNVKKIIAEILQEKCKPFYEAPSKDLLLSGAELFSVLTDQYYSPDFFSPILNDPTVQWMDFSVINRSNPLWLMDLHINRRRELKD